MTTLTAASLLHAETSRQDDSAKNTKAPTQLGLPTGPTNLASSRSPDQVENNRAFLAAAGRVEFGRHEGAIQRTWMAFAYFASLSDERLCYATIEHIGEKALSSGRTVQRHMPAIIKKGLLETDGRKGGREPTRWRVVVPEDVGAGVTFCHPI